MAGQNGGAGDRSDGAVAGTRALSRLVNENPWAVIAIALISGGTGGSLLGAPDRFTGTQGAALESRIRDLEQMQSLDDQHRRDSVEGYRMIDNGKQRLTSLEAEIRQMRRELDRLQRGER